MQFQNNLFKFDVEQRKKYTLTKNFILGCFILALSIIANMIHIPISFGMHGIEKIEVGNLVPLSLIGFVSSWVLIAVMTILPIIDYMLHAHFMPMLPFDMLFNFMLFVLLLSLNSFINLGFKKETSEKRSILFLFGFAGAVLLKFPYIIIAINLFSNFEINWNWAQPMGGDLILMVFVAVNFVNFLIVFFVRDRLRAGLIKKFNINNYEYAN